MTQKILLENREERLPHNRTERFEQHIHFGNVCPFEADASHRLVIIVR